MLQQVFIVEFFPCEEVCIIIAFRKVIGVIWSSIHEDIGSIMFFFLSLVMIVWALCLNGLDMGMSHKPYFLFLCHFKISFLFLEYWSHSCIICLCSHCRTAVLRRWLRHCVFHQKRVPFLHGCLNFLTSRCSLFFVAFMVELFGNYTVGPSQVWLSLLSTNISSVRQ